jgi:predicted DNA-binding protein
MTQKNVRVDLEQYERLQAISDKTRVPLADLVRQALEQFLKHSK